MSDELPADPDWLVDLRRAMHPFLASLETDFCSMCGDPAAHKVGEEHDLPFHNLSNYLCCWHFKASVGDCEGYPYEQLAGATREVDYSANYATPAATTDPATSQPYNAVWGPDVDACTCRPIPASSGKHLGGLDVDERCPSHGWVA